MLINLIPDFFALLDSTDPVAAYRRYYSSHLKILEPYWRNYVLDPDTSHFDDVARSVMGADRRDLRAMLERTDVVSLARETEYRCSSLLELDSDIDVVLMVGVGAANAGELVTEGRGIAFVCLEHFTGVANPDTQGLGLDPALIPLWLAHEIAHAVRYTSPSSRSTLRQLISDAGGYYSYWDTGRRATLREHVINEGIAVEAARIVSPGHAEWEYYGYSRRQYARIRELEGVLVRAVASDLDRTGLGLRLRYLSDGLSDESRTIEQYIIPERAGYYLGSRMVERAVTERGMAWTVRASADEISAISNLAAASA
jgi:hypothetical protein